MSNKPHNHLYDNEATLRLFMDKLFGKDSASFGDAGIIDAKEAFHSAQSILRSINTKHSEQAKELSHSAKAIFLATKETKNK